MKFGKGLAFSIPAFVAGTILSGSVVMAGTNYIKAQEMHNASMTVNGKTVTQVPRFVNNKTTYAGLWWIQQGLQKAGVKATWDGNMFNVSLPKQTSTSTSTTSSVLPSVSGIKASVFSQGTSTMSNPDDITMLNGNIYVTYQNGIGPKGQASSGGATNSNIVEYDKNGHVVAQWNVAGHCDGLTADTANNRIIATVNEDGNSSMYIVTPGNATPQHIKYSVDPATVKSGALATGGGTDSIAIDNGKMFISASNPSADANGNFTHSALFEASIQGNTATLSSALLGDAKATDAVSGKQVTLNLSDPDSSEVVPSNFPKYGGDVVLDSQGDAELMFIHNPGSSNQSVTRLSLGTQIDDSAFATSGQGTLYVTDNATNKVYSLSVNAKPGTVFVSCGSYVGELDLSTGHVTPVIIGLKSSHGLLFVPNN